MKEHSFLCAFFRQQFFLSVAWVQKFKATWQHPFQNGTACVTATNPLKLSTAFHVMISVLVQRTYQRFWPNVDLILR